MAADSCSPTVHTRSYPPFARFIASGLGWTPCLRCTRRVRLARQTWLMSAPGRRRRDSTCLIEQAFASTSGAASGHDAPGTSAPPPARGNIPRGERTRPTDAVVHWGRRIGGPEMADQGGAVVTSGSGRSPISRMAPGGTNGRVKVRATRHPGEATAQRDEWNLTCDVPGRPSDPCTLRLGAEADPGGRRVSSGKDLKAPPVHAGRSGADEQARGRADPTHSSASAGESSRHRALTWIDAAARAVWAGCPNRGRRRSRYLVPSARSSPGTRTPIVSKSVVESMNSQSGLLCTVSTLTCAPAVARTDSTCGLCFEQRGGGRNCAPPRIKRRSSPRREPDMRHTTHGHTS